MRKYSPPDLPRSVVESLIDEWVCGKRKRALLKEVYFDETTIETLAEEYGIGVSTVKRYLSAAQKQLYAHLVAGPDNEPETDGE